MLKKALLLLPALLLIAVFALPAPAAVMTGDMPAAPQAETEAETPADAGALDGRLAAITLLVKKQLGIDDAYSEFYGDYSSSEDAWYLHWNKSGASLSVTARSDGKILDYSYYGDERSRIDYSVYAPRYPQLSDEDLQQSAQAFLTRVLRAGESVQLKSGSYYRYAYSYDGSRHISGHIRWQGLPTQISVWLTLRADGTVSSFNRSDYYGSYIRDLTALPRPEAKIAAAQAMATLTAQSKLELVYILDGADDNGAPLAKPRYVPIYTGQLAVDAADGKLIDMDQVYDDLYAMDQGVYGAGDAAAAPEEANTARLTEAELAGVAKLEGVKTAAELEAAARAFSEFGLTEAYKLIGADYSQHQDGVKAYLQLRAEATPALLGLSKKDFDALGYKPYIDKRLTFDAKSGELQRLHTGYPWVEEGKLQNKLSGDKLQRLADAFLAKYQAAHFAKSKLRTVNYQPIVPYDYATYIWQDAYSQRFNYCQFANDIPFEGNYYYLGLNLISGEVDYYNYAWDESVVFAPTDNTVSMQQALGAYNAAFQAELSYIDYPVKSEGGAGILAEYSRRGYAYAYDYKLVYQLKSDQQIQGVDALSGELLTCDDAVMLYAYDDIAGQAAEAAILRLAAFGAGFPGESFLPEAKLSEREMLAFLLGPEYGYIDGDDEYLYRLAFDLGIIDSYQATEPERQISRGEFAKTLVKMSGYGKAAMLPGIYKLSFVDAAAIAEADYGYIAIAQGMGVIKGDKSNRFYPNRGVSRAEAAIMFDNFLSRSI